MTALAIAAEVPKQRREDIQGLRAVAILLVLIHHARLPGFPGGFLGVDMFFVISGFLMGGLIDNRLNAGTFTLRDFYARRVRRLFPAAYATLTVTALAAPWLLDSVEYTNFVGQLAGSFGFVVNIVLWRQSDYFSTAAELKPLLHMWSLAVEEQFYVGFPLLLLFCPKRLMLWALVAVVALSGIACIYLLPRAPSATFYMLPTRAWELGVGGVVAMLVNRGALRTSRLLLARIASVAAIVAAAMLSDENGHPGMAAAVVCLATCVLMVPGSVWRGRGAGRMASLAGDRSYSLYLVHWPLFAFANNVVIGPVPLSIRLALLVACFVLAELQYRLVERPLRHLKITASTLAILVAVPILVISASMVWHRAAPDMGAMYRAPNFGLSEQCAFRETFTAPPPCLSEPKARMLVWGDSFAMHLVDGLKASVPGGVVQATMMVCGPFLGIAPVDGGVYPEHWAKDCISFNDSVLEYLRRSPQIDTVALSSILIPYLEEERGKNWTLLQRQRDAYVATHQDFDETLKALTRTVNAIRALGRKVVLFAPPPSINLDFSRCEVRRLQGKPVWGSGPDCTFAQAEYQARRQKMLRFLHAVEDHRIVPVISFDSTLCQRGKCQSRWGDTILYADHAHLSRAGVVEIAHRMRWPTLIAARAK